MAITSDYETKAKQTKAKKNNKIFSKLKKQFMKYLLPLAIKNLTGIKSKDTKIVNHKFYFSMFMCQLKIKKPKQGTISCAWIKPFTVTFAIKSPTIVEMPSIASQAETRPAKNHCFLTLTY